MEKAEADLWDNFAASDGEADMQPYKPMVVHELRLYPASPLCKKSNDPLVFWAKDWKEFPKVYKVALYMLSAVSTSIRLESSCSHAGQVELDRRTIL